MKFLMTLILAVFLAAPTFAANKAPAAEQEELGGFEGPVSGAQAETVAKAKKLAQDSRVVVTGNIVSRVAGEKNEYIFKDATGEIPVTITRKGFMGHKITPEIKVRLIGKVDKQAASPDAARIKVSRLELAE